MSGIDLSDPDVIRVARARLAGFLAATGAALGGAAGELQRVRDWLWSVQAPCCKRQVRERNEAYQAARRAWQTAESEVMDAATTRGPRRRDATEERLAMERARRARDEAEERLALVEHWLLRIDREAAALVHECQGHELDLGQRGARALAELARLVDRVESYLAAPAADPAAPHPATPRDAAGGSAPCDG